MDTPVLARLTDRRMAAEKEQLALGEPKKGMNDIFRHCRGFERAYSALLQEAEVSFKIRDVVEGGLPQMLRKIPIEKRFNKNYVREICREADGYQPHLVSPERGIKRLVQEAMGLTNAHVHKFVDDIHLVLLDTVREAARRSVLSEAGVKDFNAAGRLEFLRLKGFENAVIVAAGNALEDWKKEAHYVAETMVQMECDYVTPSYFREMEREFQSQHAAGVAGGASSNDRLDALAQGRVTATGDDDSDDESTEPSPAPSSRASISRETSPTGKPGGPPPGVPQRADLKMGWLEKRTGDSSNLSALPVDSWRWQRRWFVLAMETGYLYYFKSPDQMGMPNVAPKVTINLRECVVEDYEPVAAMSQKRSTQKLDNNAGSVSLLIRIMHKASPAPGARSVVVVNPTLPVAKAHHQIILRANDASDKFEWLSFLRNACDPSGGQGKAGRLQATSAQYQGGAAQAQSPAAGTPSRGPSQGEGSPPKGLFGRTMDKMSDRFRGFGSSKLGSVTEVGSLEDLEAYYERLGLFCGTYARQIFDRMAKTVIRSRDRLLDQLYNYLSSLKPFEIENLLAEDPTVVRRRAATQQAGKDLWDSVEEVKHAQERLAGESPRSKHAMLSVRALLLAGAFPLVPRDRMPPGTDPVRLYGEYTPVTLLPSVEGGPPPQLGPPVGDGPAENGAAAPARGSSSGQEAAAPRPGSAAAAAAAVPVAAPGGVTKPRRQPPPPPPKGA
eukprot:scaffold15.g4268.t1